MKEYLKRTWKKKIAAIAMAFVGYLSTFIDGDGTGFVFILFFAAMIFFDNGNEN
jgi:hypothetical protein